MNGTEYAVKQLFRSLKYYQDLIAESMPPSFTGDMITDATYGDIQNATHDDIQNAYIAYYNSNPEFENAQEYANKKFEEYLANDMAHAAICGSILQTAHMAISKFSEYEGDCEVLTGVHKRFGIGRLVNGLPQGLIIHAGRNQYNHWDEEPRNRTRQLFDKIATKNGEREYKDPAFDIDNPILDIYSHNIIGLLEWRSYEDYERDILDMLSEFEDVVDL